MQQKILLCTFSACAGVCATGCGEAILRGHAASKRRRGTRTKRFYALKRADKISSAVPADGRSPMQYPKTQQDPNTEGKSPLRREFTRTSPLSRQAALKPDIPPS